MIAGDVTSGVTVRWCYGLTVGWPMAGACSHAPSEP